MTFYASAHLFWLDFRRRFCHISQTPPAADTKYTFAILTFSLAAFTLLIPVLNANLMSRVYPIYWHYGWEIWLSDSIPKGQCPFYKLYRKLMLKKGTVHLLSCTQCGGCWHFIRTRMENLPFCNPVRNFSWKDLPLSSELIAKLKSFLWCAW